MNKKLVPWFSGCAAFAVLIIAVYCGNLAARGEDYHGGFVWLALSFPLPWLMIDELWCACGFIGTAIEIRRDRPRALPIALTVIPVLLTIPTVLSYLQYRQSRGGMFGGFAAAGFAVLLIIFAVPIIPMVIWEIVLIMTRRRKNYDFHKISGSTVCFTSHKPLYITLFVIFAASPLIVIGAAAAQQSAYNAAQEMNRQQEQQTAAEYYRNADERIIYQNSGSLREGMFDTAIKQDTLLIDYSEKTVTFIFRGSSYKDTLKTFTLHELGYIPEMPEQFICELNAPGKRLITYCDPTHDRDMTTAISLEMADGTLLYAGMDRIYLGIEASPCRDIKEALRYSDDIVEYGANNAADGSLFPPYSLGIARNTFCLDHNNMTAYVIYCNGGDTWEDIGYKTDTGDISVCRFAFVPYDGDTEDMIPQAVVPLNTPGEYIVPYQLGTGEKWGACSGVLLYTADGCYISEERTYPWYFDFDTSEYALTEEEARRFMP